MLEFVALRDGEPQNASVAILLDTPRYLGGTARKVNTGPKATPKDKILDILRAILEQILVGIKMAYLCVNMCRLLLNVRIKCIINESDI